MAHMAWGGGWVADWGAQDFAGGNVVHMNAGVAALVASIMIGKRRGLGSVVMAPHDMTMTYTGGCMLFVGWLAFCADAITRSAAMPSSWLSTPCWAVLAVLWAG